MIKRCVARYVTRPRAAYTRKTSTDTPSDVSGVLYVELLNHNGYQADVLYDNANIMTEMLRGMRQTTPFPFFLEERFLLSRIGQ